MNKFHRKFSFPKPRDYRGNMIVLIAAVIMGIVVSLIFFCLNYSRILGTHAEQKTAIEAAALTAASDIANIVVNTDEFGFVALSDAAPIGQNTTAPDQFSMPVRSINTIIGTARLDLIIANALNDTTMQNFAIIDAQNAQKAAAKLITALNASILPSGTGKDKDGTVITPYADAVNSYNQNSIRMSGSSNYVAGSMKLTLGAVTGGISTYTPVPQPQALAPVAANDQLNGFYKSDTNIPFLGQDFVFAAVGKSATLSDQRLFVAGGDPALPYSIPCIVAAEADQMVRTSQTPAGMVVHAMACGVPSSLYDPRPAPGSMSLSFPDGPVPEIKKLNDILTNPDLNDPTVQSALLTPINGDYPTDMPASSMAPMPWPLGAGTTPPIGIVWRGAFFDWIRRAGCKANIADVVAIGNKPLDLPNPSTAIFAPITTAGGTTGTPLGPIPAGIIHVFKFDTAGNIFYKSAPHKPYPYVASSNNQMYAESLFALSGLPGSSIGTFSITPPSLPQLKGTSNVPGSLIFTDTWDAYIRDEVRQPGLNLGGKHGGEPLDNAQVARIPASVRPSETRLHHIIGLQFSVDGKHGAGSASDLFSGGQGAGGRGTGMGLGSGGCSAGTGGTSGSPPPSGLPPRGGGSIPLIGTQSDFNELMVPKVGYTGYPSGPGAVRPTYATSGTAVDITFRRQINATAFASALGFDTGYVGNFVQ